LNPQCDEAYQLISWWDRQGGNVNTFSLSTPSTSFPGGARKDEFKTFGQIKDEALGRAKTDYFITRGTITLIKHENNVWYDACPNESCNKKKITFNNGQYYCDKCKQNYPQAQQRYIMSLQAADPTGVCWLNAFNEVGEIIVGKSASEMAVLKEKNVSDLYI
jgi:replication factor A1